MPTCESHRRHINVWGIIGSCTVLLVPGSGVLRASGMGWDGIGGLAGNGNEPDPTPGNPA